MYFLLENMPILRNSTYRETTIPVEGSQRTIQQRMQSYFRLCTESDEEQLLATPESNQGSTSEEDSRLIPAYRDVVLANSHTATIEAEVHYFNW